MSIVGFRAAVTQRCQQLLARAPLTPDQRDLVLRQLARYDHVPPDAHPIFVPLSISRSAENPDPELAVSVGAWCNLQMHAFDLVDDVQDDDLAGTPHEHAGPALAINDAMVFQCVAFELLREIDLAVAPRPLFAPVVARLLAIGAGQHRILAGVDTDPQRALDGFEARAASTEVFAFVAAVAAGCDDDEVSRWCALTRERTRVLGLVGELQDIFGKARSPDFESGQMTVLVSLFHDLAGEDQRRELAALRHGDPRETMPAVRRLLYESGAVAACAELVERSRARLHALVAEGVGSAASGRLILDKVDARAALVYELPELPVTATLRAPNDGWNRGVREAVAHMHRQFAEVARAEPPTLRAWWRPQWLYVPDEHALMVPDPVAFPLDVLGEQARAMGVSLGEAATVVYRAMPAVVAHECCHAWRARRGLLCGDTWWEELVATRFAVSWAKAHAPEAFAAAARGVAAVVDVAPPLSPAATRVVDDLLRPDASPAARRGLLDEMSLEEATVAQAVLSLRLASRDESLDDVVRVCFAA